MLRSQRCIVLHLHYHIILDQDRSTLKTSFQILKVIITGYLLGSTFWWHAVYMQSTLNILQRSIGFWMWECLQGTKIPFLESIRSIQKQFNLPLKAHFSYCFFFFYSDFFTLAVVCCMLWRTSFWSSCRNPPTIIWMCLLSYLAKCIWN